MAATSSHSFQHDHILVIKDPLDFVPDVAGDGASLPCKVVINQPQYQKSLPTPKIG